MARATARPKAKKAAVKKATKKRASVSARTGKKAAARRAVPRRSTARTAQAQKPSKTTIRAKWIESADEHEDRPGQSLATRNHEVIMKWAEERGAEPATVESTRHDGRPGVLRFDFPGFGGGRRLQKISWDEWFKSFDERSLLFVYQEHMKKGNESNFFRLDNPEREEA